MWWSRGVELELSVEDSPHSVSNISSPCSCSVVFVPFLTFVTVVALGAIGWAVPCAVFWYELPATASVACGSSRRDADRLPAICSNAVAVLVAVLSWLLSPKKSVSEYGFCIVYVGFTSSTSVCDLNTGLSSQSSSVGPYGFVSILFHVMEGHPSLS